MAELETPPAPAVAATETVTNGRWAGYWHLLGARMRELQREPEVIFWVFVFPLLLALGLGIAFRNKPADVTSIAIVSGPGARDTLAPIARPSTAPFARRSLTRPKPCRISAWANMILWSRPTPGEKFNTVTTPPGP